MRLLIDEMFAAAIAESLRDSGIDAIAIQEVPELRGLPDDQVFVHAQLEQRCVVTENIADFVAVETAWRAEQPRPHRGLILVHPRGFPRHRRGAIGRIAQALRALVTETDVEPGTILWLDGSA
ncbi:MAG: DUF5615 family PIN-like protein [Acidimicrobiia bacterium]|nr:DUF5615 family PIN-like protein [Acidimicrobiia bacterium]